MQQLGPNEDTITPNIYNLLHPLSQQKQDSLYGMTIFVRNLKAMNQ